jgi:hypothetical protein
MKMGIEKKLRKKPGIYKIVNLVNGKYYVGGAYNLDSRYRAHKSELKKGNHANSRLQRSYNKYGTDSFEFALIEILDKTTEVRDREQFHLDNLKSPNCYNLSKTVEPTSLNNRYRRNFYLIDPSGKTRTFKNTFLAHVARDIEKEYNYQVDITGLWGVINEKTRSYKGWRLPKNKNYDYVNWRKNREVTYSVKNYDVQLLSPSGEIFGPFTNLKEFCEDHDIENPASICNLLAGRTRYINGWSVYNGTKEKPHAKNSKTLNIKLKSPGGKIYGPITNLSLFCREHNLNYGSVRSYLKVNDKQKNYKGWFLT